MKDADVFEKVGLRWLEFHPRGFSFYTAVHLSTQVQLEV
jgi:hypothetical protein